MAEQNKPKLFRLSPKLIDRLDQFYGLNKSRLGFKNQRDSIEMLLDIGLEEVEKVTKIKKNKNNI